MTDTTTDVVAMKLANDIMNMPSYVKVVKVNNGRMGGRGRELLALLNTSQLDGFMNAFRGITGMFGNTGGLHESLIGSLNKGYYNEMEAGAVDGGYGPQGKNLPSNNPNRQRYEQYGRSYNQGNQSSQGNQSRYDRYDGNSNRYYNNDSNDYDNNDTYGQGPGCTPNVDGSRDRRCREPNMGNNSSNNSNYQNQGGSQPNVGEKLNVDKSLLSSILTR
ncbi:hypothetical protein AMV151 [Betaentomopoxvirus amoorei]|uniref:AMV151 n=1 Tax=Amsacta moorei entomopoxvirus TaxID=28321 RepID=Q9EMP8_AMEPV|nr:hypothetical protein AMV151 [Amsacta moorei entomopoxvirus]AAG02857.1 AMV151 [Amsacta moorei entomopoxvirus]